MGSIDVATSDEDFLERLEPVAASRGISPTLRVEGTDAAAVRIAPEWLDRLIDVLVDDALHFAADSEEVQLRVVSDRSTIRIVPSR